MDLITVTFAAVLAIPVTAGITAWLGFLAGRRPGTKQITPYSCGCGHPLGMHDADTGRCHGKELHKDVNNDKGKYIGHQLLQCECRRYVGDFPVDQIDWSQVPLPAPSTSTSTDVATHDRPD